MKKTLIVSLALFSSFLLSGCTLQKNNSNKNDLSSSKKDETKEFSIKELIAQNISQKCSWTIEDNSNKTTAEILIKGNKFKQTIVSNFEQGQNTINSISDGQYIYIWSNDKTSKDTFAMKMKAEDSQVDKDSTSPISTQVDLDQKHKLNCSPTTTSDSDFMPPKDINFTDYGQFLDQIKSSIPSITQESLDSE